MICHYFFSSGCHPRLHQVFDFRQLLNHVSNIRSLSLRSRWICPWLWALFPRFDLHRIFFCVIFLVYSLSLYYSCSSHTCLLLFCMLFVENLPHWLINISWRDDNQIDNRDENVYGRVGAQFFMITSILLVCPHCLSFFTLIFPLYVLGAVPIFLFVFQSSSGEKITQKNKQKRLLFWTPHFLNASGIIHAMIWLISRGCIAHLQGLKTNKSFIVQWPNSVCYDELTLMFLQESLNQSWQRIHGDVSFCW